MLVGLKSRAISEADASAPTMATARSARNECVSFMTPRKTSGQTR